MSKNSFKYSVLIIALLILPVLSTSRAEMNMEIGDALFTDGFNLFGVEFGHSIVYYGWNGNGDPFDLINQMAIEAMGLSPLGESKRSELTTLKRDKSYWANSSFTKSNPNWQQRATITKRAYELLGKKYPSRFEFFSQYKGPEKWRCDGIVEDCYENAGIDIYPNAIETGVTLSPLTQNSKMESSIGEGPQVKVLGVLLNNETKIVSLAANAADVSGIAKMEFWDGMPGLGTQLGWDSITENSSQALSFNKQFNLNTRGGSHILFVKAYDGAGNSTISSGKDITLTSGPIIIKIMPPAYATGVPLRPTISFVFDRKVDNSTVNNASIKLYEYDTGAEISGSVNIISESAVESSWSFTPSANLKPNTKYKFIVKNGVKDLAGYPIDGNQDGKVGDDYLSTFQTGDISVINRILQLSKWSWVARDSTVNTFSVSAQSVSAQSTADNKIDPGETIELTLTLTNTGSNTAASVSGELASPPGVSIKAGTQTFGDIAPGGSASNINKYIFTVQPSFAGNIIEFNLSVNGNIDGKYYSDKIYFTLPVGSPFLTPPGWNISSVDNFGFLVGPAGEKYKIDDKNNGKEILGNGNGVFDEGDFMINLVFYIGNATADKINASVTLMDDSNNKQISFNDGALKNNIEIQPYSYREVSFNISLTTYLQNRTSIPLSAKLDALGSTVTMPLVINYSVPPPENIYIESIEPSNIFSPSNDGINDDLKINIVPSKNIDKGRCIYVREKREDGSVGEWQVARSEHIIDPMWYANNKYWISWTNGEDFPSGCYEIFVYGWSLLYDDYYGLPYADESQSKNITVFLYKDPPKAENLSVTEKVSALNPLLPASIKVSFDLSHISDLSMKLMNSDGKEVNKLVEETLSPKGRKEFSFVNYDSNDNLLPDGKYELYLTLNDRANPIVYVSKEVVVDNAPQDFFIVAPTREVISASPNYPLSWTPATLYNPEWNHLKEYQIWARRTNENEQFSLLRDNIGPNVCSESIQIDKENTWEVVVRAIDDEGNWRDSDGASNANNSYDPKRRISITIDKIPPLVELALAPPAISPNADGINDSLGVKYLIADNLSSSLEVKISLIKDGKILDIISDSSLPSKLNYSDYYLKWDGKIGSYVIEGNYVLQLKAIDLAGNIAIATQEVLVDFQPPRIENVTLSNPYFSPNGDGKKDNTEISFYLNDNYASKMPTTILVEDKDGKEAATIAKRIELKPGEHTFTWEGTADGGRLAADGNYKFKIYAEDEAGNLIKADSGSVVVDTIPPALNAKLSSDIFSPNEDGKYDGIDFDLTLSEKAEIYFDIKKVIDTWLYETDKLKITWKNKGFLFGEEPLTLGYVPYDGKYGYTIFAEDKAGNLSNTASGEVEIDTTPPKVLAFDISNKKFSPNGDGRKDATRFSLETDEPSSSTILVVGGSGIIRKIPGRGLLSSGSFSWDGLADSGVKAADGYFKVKVVTEDRVANSDTYFESWHVKVDTVPPIFTASPNIYTFSPNSDGNYDSVDFSLKSNEDGVANLRLTANNLQLFSGIIKEDHTANVTWDGSSLPEGIYTYEAYADDEAANQSAVVNGKIRIDTAPPEIENFYAAPDPFSPNNDGIKDTTTFNYQLSEPAYITTQIFLAEDGSLFRKHSGLTENFNYAAFPEASGTVDADSGSWIWDGRGSRGELLGGYYQYHLEAVDAAGNRAATWNKVLFVDRAPSLIPYAYAEPDPFAPKNPANSSSDVYYYLSKDNLWVTVSIIGEGEEILRTLIANEPQTKGKHRITWDGRVNGIPVVDGTHQYRVSVEDPDGEAGESQQGTVVADSTPPTPILDPVAADNVTQRATLTYQLPEEATVEVSVYRPVEELVERALNPQQVSAGKYTLVWQNGHGGSNYYFKVAATDKALNSVVKATEIFALGETAPLSVGGHYATPNPFTPNGDARADQTRIGYCITGGAPDYRVSINILNSIGATVKRLVEDETQSSGTYSFYWDGKDDGRRTIDDGRYEYVITAEDKLGSRIEQRGSILAISTRPTVDLLTNLSVFSPNGDGSKDTVTFNYSINYPTFYITGEALVKLEVLNATGEAVWSRIFNHSAGSYIYEYNGLTATGLLLPAGNYYVRASAEDALGTTAVPKTVSLQVDYNEPVVAIQSISPDPFSPYPNGVNDQTVISYTLAKPAYVTVKVKQGEAVVKTLQSNQWTEAYVSGLAASKVKAFGIPTVTWDGKDGTGSFVADGTYSIEISATDSAGNASTSSALITVDNTRPTIPIVDSLPANTNQGLQNINGSAEPSSLVKVYINDNPASSGNAFASGSFSIPTNLFAGANNIKLTAADAAGNTSDLSPIQLVNYETDAPIISNVTVTPNPAKAGPVMISFTVSETLESDPVVKINSETATFSRRFSNQSGWSYEYVYNVSASDQQGAAIISIEAVDLAGNLTSYQTNQLLTIDTVNTTISNADIDVEGNPRSSSSTAYAKLGSKIRVDFSVSESLLTDPVVSVGGNIADKESKTIYSPSRIDYSYSHNITNADPDGTTPVSIEVTDLAGNVSTFQPFNVLTIDKISPEVSNLSVSPNPASVQLVSGQVSIKFNVSEPLKEAPRVYVTQNGAVPSLTYGSQLTANSYEYKYGVVPGCEGPALITIEVTDLANNPTTYQPGAILAVDTIAPTFSNVAADPIDAKEGTEVAISFTTSERLKFNPDVKVNGNPAQYVSFDNPDEKYAYSYTINWSDSEGPAKVEIAGYDFASNQGEKTQDNAFTIDLTKPEIVIANQPDLIANPGTFTPNNNTADGQDFTTLKYTLDEYSKVSVKIYGFSPAKQYNGSNLAAVLIDYPDNIWKPANVEQGIVWDGRVTYNTSLYDKDNNGFADGSEYAFIVEAKDKAGNISYRRGGTVWVQDIKLTMLESPRANTTNPDPKVISPDGPVAAKQETKIYFKIDAKPEPTATKEPEPILEVFAVPEQKPVGRLFAKVFDSNGNLVKVIADGITAVEGENNPIEWDGKNVQNIKVADGVYIIKAWVKDFTGVEASGSPLQWKVVVDNTPPNIRNLAVDNVFISPVPPPAQPNAVKQISISYNASDNLSVLSGDIPNRVDRLVEILKDSSPIQTVVFATSEVNSIGVDFTNVWDGKAGSSYVGDRNNNPIYKDGKYKYRVTLTDTAGNITSQEGEVTVDTIGPTGSVVINKTDTNMSSDPEYTTSPSVRLSVTGNDTNLDKMRIKNDGGSWTAWESIISPRDWTISSLDALKRVYVEFIDKAGNVNTTAISDTITLDTHKPLITSAPAAPPIAQNRASTTLTLNFEDTESASWQLIINNSSGGSVKSFSGTGKTAQGTWDGAGQSDGKYYYCAIATDRAGNILRSYEDGYGSYKPYTGSNNTYYMVEIDRTPPQSCSVSITNATYINGSNKYINSSSVNLSLSASDTHSVSQMKISNSNSFDGATTYSYSTSKSWTISSKDSWNTIYVWFQDGVGNWTQSPVTDKIFWDNTAPTTNAPSTSTPTNNQRPTWSWSASSDTSGIEGYYLKVGTSAGGSNTISETWVGNVTFWTHPTDLSDGNYHATIKAKDKAENIGNYGSSGSVLVDTVKPTFSNVSDSPDPFSPNYSFGVKDSITISYTIDEAATVKIYIDGSEKYSESKTVGTYSWAWSPGLSVSEGTHSYYLYAVDNAGNPTTSFTYYFTVDNTPPGSPAGLSATSGNGVANLSWSSVSGADGYYVYRSVTYNGTYSKVSGFVTGTSYQDSGLSNGTRYWYKLTAGDNAGNESGFSNYVRAIPGILGNSKILFWDRGAYGIPNEVYRIDINGINQIRLTNNSAQDCYASFSPDDSKIVFTSTRDGNWEIYIMNADGSNQIRLTSNAADDSSPSFSPDGFRIVFSSDRDGNCEIYSMNVDGSNQTRLTNSSGADINPRYSPDGTKIVFVSSRNLSWGYEIYVMDANGSNQTKLTTSTGNSSDNTPSFSPDGTKIIYSSDRGKSIWNYDIYTMDIEGNNQTRLTVGTSMNGKSVYSPDGTKIAFCSTRNGSPEIYTMDADGSNQMRLLASSDIVISDWSNFGWGMRWFSVSIAPQSTTLDPPQLIAPKDVRDPAYKDVTTLRPTFEWKHRKENTTEYKIDLAKDRDFGIAPQSFSKSASSGSQDGVDKNLYYFTYSIHEFDPGLDRDTYYWKVTALSTGEAATSEVWSFRIQPDLTLTGVTNYPNPFNPNKEKTKIRYRLSTDASEVKIRIYDITGSLVTEMDGTTNGEESSVWNKYNDVEWDGRNGRGDVVLNGIYPFEVTARLGEKSVSGRGKIAVLK